MIILVVSFTILHIVFYLRLAYRWRQLPNLQEKVPFTSFSVIIPVRNEEKNITRILSRLADQSYPANLFEVIIVDDFSDDETVSIARKLIEKLDISCKLIKLQDKASQGKKHALTAGVKASKYETILTTDADCWFNADWIKSYNNAFDKDIMMVAGPVAIRGEGFFARLQQVEFAGLMGFGAVTISEENPSMCSGANLGFRKSAFEEVGGYANNLFTPSGDDEFLLYNVMSKFPNSTLFLKQNSSIVNTQAHLKLKAFLNQRTRWTSKWKHNLNWKVRASAILFFLDYLVFYLAIIGIFIGWFPSSVVVSLIILRFLSLYLFVYPINTFLEGRGSFWTLLVFQIIYPMHVLFMGMNSIFGSYTWKGRKY